MHICKQTKIKYLFNIYLQLKFQHIKCFRHSTEVYFMYQINCPFIVTTEKVNIENAIQDKLNETRAASQYVKCKSALQAPAYLINKHGVRSIVMCASLNMIWASPGFR